MNHKHSYAGRQVTLGHGQPKRQKFVFRIFREIFPPGVDFRGLICAA
jgi:hypothetical protein